MLLNEKHKQFFQDESRYLLFYGGAGAGKSYSIEDKIILNCVIHKKLNKKIKIVVIRKSFPSLRRTCWSLLQERLLFHGIPFKTNNTWYSIEILGSEVLFLSVNNPIDYEKVKSLTDVTMIWIEEASEISRQAYQDIIQYRLRGGEGIYPQIILSFNPISKTNWLYDFFFMTNRPDCSKIKTTIEDNDFLKEKDPGYYNMLVTMKDYNLNSWKVNYLGDWGESGEAVYNNYKIGVLPDTDNYWYGMDFGFNNPTSLVKCSEKDQRYYAKCELYQTKLTNTELIEKLKDIIIDLSKIIYCDNAEPNRIEELRKAGFNAVACKKGTVIDRKNYINSLDLTIDEDSSELLKELQSSAYQIGVDGKPTETPIKFNDHAIDAMGYGFFSREKQIKKQFAYGEY